METELLTAAPEKERFVLRFLRAVLCILSGLLSCVLLCFLLLGGGNSGASGETHSADLAIMDRYDMYMTNAISSALDGVLSIDKVYWLHDTDTIAPEPDPGNYEKVSAPTAMEEFLRDAQALLGVEDTLFSTDTELMPGSEITCYLDETIMVITWKQVFHGAVYTISEVKIDHPSQFRRFLADGVYGSDKQYKTTQMAETVNAVTASSGDFYKFRPYGITVYNGEVQRFDSRVDTCFITDTGEMLFAYRGEITDLETAQKYVEENGVRFSLAFGPVLVDNYQKVAPNSYPVGEVQNWYSRAALAQMGELHYLLIACNQENGLINVPTISMFADQLMSFGVEKAYCLDGGQTAAIVTGDELINRPDWGYQRLISDIIYFATAVPEGG